MTTSTALASSSSAVAPMRRGSRLRRLGGTLIAAGAVAVGGASVLPSGVAEAAGISQDRLQHVATTPEAPATTTTSTVGSLDPSRRQTMRIRVDASGAVL